MTGDTGGGLFLYGLTRNAPTACMLGTLGLALVAEGITNAGIEDLISLPQKAGERKWCATCWRD